MLPEIQSKISLDRNKVIRYTNGDSVARLSRALESGFRPESHRPRFRPHSTRPRTLPAHWNGSEDAASCGNVSWHAYSWTSRNSPQGHSCDPAADEPRNS